MREIKFRTWDKVTEKMGEVSNMDWSTDGWRVCCFEKGMFSGRILMQFTGLLDKNGLIEIYECDIIDSNGIVIGNLYETPEIHKTGTHHIVAKICTEDWRNTEEKLLSLGCKYAK